VIVGNLLSGGIVMNEFDFYSKDQLMMLFCGTFICVIGIFYKVSMIEDIKVLSKNSMKSDQRY
jgi:hypothetical protein